MKPDRDATEKTIQVADDLVLQTDSILESFAKLQEEIARLQSLKNQYQIYLQLFNDDRILLQDMYQSMRRILSDRANTNYPSEVVKQGTPKNNDGKPLPYALFHTTIKWEIDIQNPFFNKDHLRLRYALNANSVICTITFNSTGELYAFADGRTIFLVNSQDGSLLQTFHIPQSLDQKEMQTRALLFSKDSKYLVSNGSDNLIYIYETATGKEHAVLEGHSDIASSFLFSPDSQQLISAGFDGKIIIWDLKTKTALKVINHNNPSSDTSNNTDNSNINNSLLSNNLNNTKKNNINNNTINNNNNNTINNNNNNITINNNNNNTINNTINNNNNTISNNNNNNNNSTNNQNNNQANSFINNIQQNNQNINLQNDFRDREALINDIVFGIDDEIILVGFMSGKVGIYEPTFSQEMNEFRAHHMPLLGLTSSRKSGLICTASQDNTLKVWSLRGVASCKHTLISHTKYVLTSAFSPNSRYLFSGSKDESMKMWNVKTGELECTINAHQNTVFRIDHHPTENSFLSCGGDGLICFWEYDVPEEQKK
ncbi:hypothetical protein TRFO_15697 [Tritrichomonas foetus]|uniref:Uncharacterized protein n=1 Tax=Tritrichomonas foetus TaxID=1144522 RepID=A0A1J4KWW7_9EUKA|nr:hypothetical protein TRFO_15697 [Tritrichomonas foetus]|eukprot:OHT14037.1 hypothetical protein TRFO_15697 [Tritrichomonas foetus]